MKCCEVKVYILADDPESDRQFITPIQPRYCPFCGKVVDGGKIE